MNTKNPAIHAPISTAVPVFGNVASETVVSVTTVDGTSGSLGVFGSSGFGSSCVVGVSGFGSSDDGTSGLPGVFGNSCWNLWFWFF